MPETAIITTHLPPSIPTTSHPKTSMFRQLLLLTGTALVLLSMNGCNAHKDDDQDGKANNGKAFERSYLVVPAATASSEECPALFAADGADVRDKNPAYEQSLLGVGIFPLELMIMLFSG